MFKELEVFFVKAVLFFAVYINYHKNLFVRCFKRHNNFRFRSRITRNMTIEEFNIRDKN